MTTNQEKCYSLSFLIATPSSRTLDGLFELTQHPSKALDTCVAFGTTEIQGHRQLCCAWRGGPRTPSRIAYANLYCVFVKKPTFFTNP